MVLEPVASSYRGGGRVFSSNVSLKGSNDMRWWGKRPTAANICLLQ